MSELESYIPRFTRQDLLGHQLIFLVDFEWAGKIVHLAERDLVAPIGPGNADVQYFSGLEWGGTFEQLYTLFGDEPDSKDVGVTLHLYPHIDVPLLISQGHILGAAGARFRVWAEGTNAVLTLVEGKFKDPSWDINPLPVVGTIEEAPFLDEGQWPPPTHKITLDTWPNHDDAVDGEFYPTIFGAPGRSGGHMHATPGLYVDKTNHLLLVAGHHVDCGGSKIWVSNTSDHTDDYLTVVNGVDALGQPIALVDMDEIGTITIAAGDSYWCRWYDSTGALGYGIIDEGKPVKTADQVLKWWLRRSTVRWDAGQIAVSEPILAAYAIDCYVMADPEERITPYFWIQDHLLPILPVSASIGPRGLQLPAWDYFSDSTGTPFHIQEGVNAERRGAVEYTNLDDIVSTVGVAFRHDPDAGDYLGMITLSGNPAELTANEESLPDLYLRMGFQSYNSTNTLEVNTEVVETEATAGRIAQWKARRYATQYMRLAYNMSTEGASLLAGTPIRITDAGRHFAGKMGLVESIQLQSNDLLTITLLLPAIDFGNPA